jgi:DNA-binding NarL/FixJ family response regulator
MAGTEHARSNGGRAGKSGREPVRRSVRAVGPASRRHKAVKPPAEPGSRKATNARPESVPRAVRIVIVDDHPMIKRMLRLAIEERPGLQVVGEASDGAEGLELCRSFDPDMVVLDLALPVMHGFDVVRRLRQEGSGARILILTGSDESGAVLESVRLGVHGYIEKTLPPEEIARAVETVAGGVRAYGPHEQRMARVQLLEKARAARRAAEAAASLTPRERQVLGLIATGSTNRQMASRLRISEFTVEAHIANVYAKLGVRGRVEAAQRATELGLAGSA